MWETLAQTTNEWANELGVSQSELSAFMDQANAVYDPASDGISEIAKSKLRSMAEYLRRETSDLCRIIARVEADRKDSDIQPLVEGLESAILDWRGDRVS